MTKQTLYPLFFLVLLGCGNSKLPEQCPVDFNFSFSFGYFGDTWDTKKGTYNRGDTIVNIEFTEDDKKKVWQALRVNDFQDLPEKFLCDGPVIVPCPEYKLTVIMNGRRQTVSNEKGCEHTKETMRLREIVEEILRVLRSKEEIKGLPRDTRMAL